MITALYTALDSLFGERQRRLYAAVEAKVFGYGGVKRVHEATGLARGSIVARLKEWEQGAASARAGRGCQSARLCGC